MAEPSVARVPPNGAGAAAILAVAIGSVTLGVLALLADAYAGIAHHLVFRQRTGPLSGVTDVAILVWLGSWTLLSHLWADRNVRLGLINAISAALFIAALLLTFPPFMDFLQGR